MEVYGDAVNVVSTGKSRLSGLYFSSEIPVKYEAIDDKYVLNLNVDLNAYWPTLEISAVSRSNSRELFLRPDSNSECSRFYHSPEYVLKDELRRSLNIEWSPPFYCKNEPNGGELYFSVQIYDGLGNFVGEKKVNFRIVSNGTVFRSDAI